MSRPATQAKTTPPAIDDVLARERLLSLLDAKRRARLLWIVGPPGAGKTTLASSYLQSRSLNALWYQVDASDSDLATFYYFLADVFAGDATELELPLFTSEYHANESAFARQFFSTLFDFLRAPFSLVLDNYQELRADSGVHQAVREAATLLPPGCSILALSRNEPPPALVRFRANRDLEVLSWQDLRLSREESDSIARRWHPGISDLALERIYTMTEGWAAGLILTLEQHAFDGEFWLELSELSTSQLVFDYLAGELLATLDEPLPSVLLRTAVLPEMSGAMARELSEIEQAPELLAAMQRANQLVSLKRGPNGALFQYHPLLREFLLTRAREQLGPEQVSMLSARAAWLLEREGKFSEAVELMHDAQNIAGIERLVLDNALELVGQGRAATLEKWLRYLDDIESNCDRPHSPWIDYWKAVCCMQRSPLEAESHFVSALEAFRTHEPNQTEACLLVCASAMESIIYALDDFSALDFWLAQVEVMLPSGADGCESSIVDPEVRARLTVGMLLALVFRRPHSAQIAQWAGQALGEVQDLADRHVRTTAQLLIAINLNYTGQYSKVRSFIDTLRARCSGPSVPPLVLSTLYTVESMYFMLTGDAARCEDAVTAGVEVCTRSGVHVWSFHLLANGAGGALGDGNLQLAARYLEQMSHQVESARRLDCAIFHFFSSWLHALRGETELAIKSQYDAVEVSTQTGCPFYESVCRLVLAQLQIESGDRRAAIPHLRRVRSTMRHVQNSWFAFMALTLFAWMCFAERRPKLGMRMLRRGLAIGREYGYTHFLMWRPELAGELCARALEGEVEPEYVRELIIRKRLCAPSARTWSWPRPVRITTLGRFEIETNGENVPLGRSQKPLQLLKLLVCLGPGAVHESSICDQLWPRVDSSYARNSLTTNVHRLRKLLGDDAAVIHHHAKVSINESICTVDCHQVLRILERELSADTPTRLAKVLFDFYGGPLFPDDRSTTVSNELERRRAALDHSFQVRVTQLANQLHDSGQVEEAIALLRKGLERAPLAEGLCVRLVQLLVDSGRESAALGPILGLKSAMQASGNELQSAEARSLFERTLSMSDLTNTPLA